MITSNRAAQNKAWTKCSCSRSDCCSCTENANAIELVRRLVYFRDIPCRTATAFALSGGAFFCFCCQCH